VSVLLPSSVRADVALLVNPVVVAVTRVAVFAV
jgi:hypothetical protein